MIVTRGNACILVVVLLTGLLAGAPRRAPAQELPKKNPLTVTADKLDYDRTSDVYIAVGHVKIEQEGTRLEADRVVLNNKTGEAEAEGKVYLQDKGTVIHAEKIKTNLNTSQGVITKGDLFMKKDNFHVKGDVIDRRSETIYHVEHGEFTTCDEKQWFIKAKVMDIDMEKYATGNGVSFNVEGVPMLYSPYFLFPVRRQSGFLLPVVGHSSSDGIFAENAFFWALSDSKDMTISSDYREKTGYGTGIEYRYMNSSESMGQAYTKVWDMYHTGQTRWNLSLQHKEEFAEDLSARVDINLVSDELYFIDLEKDLASKSKPYLDSNAFYVERWNTTSLYLLGQYSSDLTTTLSTDLTPTTEKTVQKMPELRYTIYEEALAGPLHLNFEGSATNFSEHEVVGTQRIDLDIRRVDFNPQLSAVFGSSGLSLTPRAGVRATFYDHSADSAEPSERKYFYASADLNARISEVYGADGEVGIGRIRHSIEPTISYAYIPYIDQSNIPQFDSVDAVSSQNTTTLSIINRLTAHYKESKDSPTPTSFDMMVLKLSQSYDLTARGQNSEQNGTTRPWSDILGELSVKTPKMFSLTANGDYNTYDHTIESYTFGGGLTTSKVSASLSEQYTEGTPPTRSLTEGIGLNLGKWNFTGTWQRDLVNRITNVANYGLKYSTQCWGITLTYNHSPGDYRFMAMVDLTGLGSRGRGKQ